MLATLAAVLDGLGPALLMFGAFTLSFLLLGVGLATTLSVVDASPGGLIARRGLISAHKISKRAVRVAERRIKRPIVVPYLFMHTVLVRSILLNSLVSLSIIGFGPEIPRIQGDLTPTEYGTTAALITPITLYVSYHSGYFGFRRAMRAAAARSPRERWPPTLPGRTNWVSRERHWNASKQLYVLHLHGYLMQASIWATALSIVITSYTDMVDGDFTAWSSIAVQLGVVFILGSLISRFAAWGCYRLETANQISVFLRQWQPPQPNGANRRPVQDRARLIAIVLMTERVADRLQRRQKITVRHPIAHVLWLSAAHLRQHLASVESVVGGIPPRVEMTLRRLSAILIRSDRLGFLRECEARLSDSAGDVVQAPARRPWSERFPGAVDLTDKTTRLMTLLLIVGLLTWLAYTKQIPLTDFVQWLPQ